MDPHLALAHSEESRPTCPRCKGHDFCDEGCAVCYVADNWPGVAVYCDQESHDGCPPGASFQTWYGVTFGRVKWANEGEAEGGLGALARFMAHAAGAVDLPPPSPAGWYVQGTWNKRGEWSRPVGPFGCRADAIQAGYRAMDSGSYYTDEASQP